MGWEGSEGSEALGEEEDTLTSNTYTPQEIPQVNSEVRRQKYQAVCGWEETVVTYMYSYSEFT